MNSDRAVPRWVSEKIAEAETPATDVERAVLDEVLRCMRRVRFGSVQLTVQDSRVIQIDILEKKRL
jgi:hypothetical protein